MAYASLATGILLAAGVGSRFDPHGVQNKLLARQIELLDKAQEYRCCPADEQEDA